MSVNNVCKLQHVYDVNKLDLLCISVAPLLDYVLEAERPGCAQLENHRNLNSK